MVEAINQGQYRLLSAELVFTNYGENTLFTFFYNNSKIYETILKCIERLEEDESTNERGRQIAMRLLYRIMLMKID